MGDDADRMDALVGDLEPEERNQRWTHLSLCVLDAVFSIGAHYTSTTRVAWRYAEAANLPEPLLPQDRARDVIGSGREEPLPHLIARIDEQGLDRWMETELDNRQLTSTRSGIPKAHAARKYAGILVGHGVTSLDHVPPLLRDGARLAGVEEELARVRGHGRHGIRVGYLWMLAGDDQHVKPDRMVLRWLGAALDRPIGVDEARSLISDTAARLDLTPWAVDHAIWRAARAGRRGTG